MSSPSSSPRRRRHRRSRSRALLRRCERTCCAVATYFPLAFVYSLTTWAVYVEASIGLTRPGKHFIDKPIFSFIGIALYLLLNTSYTIAVFTDPGSPLGDRQHNNSKRWGTRSGGDYSHLPTTEPILSPTQHSTHSITVSSTGSPRYCKKCSTPKPDRTHHCSTCGRCVLKMDHHCPWLATCVGLHNYKAFLLFLIYTCLFCYVCFLVGGVWAWTEILGEDMYVETAMPAQVVLLAVISGIIGLVLTGFTGWHVYLAARNQTTIEALEKTRYLDPMRKAVERTREEQNHLKPNTNSEDPLENLNNTLHRATNSLLTTHANAIPGATRIEEGEEHSSPTLSAPLPHLQPNPPPHPSSSSPARSSLASHLHHTPPPNSHPTYNPTPYALREAALARHRHETYLSETSLSETTHLPNAFDLGLRRNLLHLLGPRPWLWGFPVCNTTGDGWSWPVSVAWREASRRLEERRRREAEIHAEEEERRARESGYGYYNEDARLSGGAGGDDSGSGNRTYGAAPPPPPSREGMLSLHTLHRADSGSHSHSHNSRGMPSTRSKRRTRTRTRRDWDGRGADVESFEVSDDDDDDGGGDDGGDSMSESESESESGSEGDGEGRGGW
ncbi:MAG: hypothetical protein Q9160_000637 [Pyrenula sp. 1 TL-2023]